MGLTRYRIGREYTERRKGAWGGESSDPACGFILISRAFGVLAPVNCVGSRPFLASYNIQCLFLPVETWEGLH